MNRFDELTPEQKRIIANVKATMEISGFDMSDYPDEITIKYFLGELTGEECIELIKKKHGIVEQD